MLRLDTRRLIEGGHRFSPFYEDSLANHLPMAVAALEHLGASDEEIAAFAQDYSKRLDHMPPLAGQITEATAADYLGRRRAVASWVSFFRARIVIAGPEATTRLWLDRLMPGVGSVAFHGLLRLSYAVENGGAGELAHALAAWAADFTTLGPLPEFASPGLSPDDALAGIDCSKGRYPGGTIVDRMQVVKVEPAFTAAVASAGAAGITTAAMASAVHWAYRATRSFTLLHGVTACHALRLLTPLMTDEAAGRLYLWQALACAYMSAGGLKAGPSLAGDETLNWEQLARLAAVARDEHDIKLVYTCRQEGEFYADDSYRRTASAYMTSRTS